MGMCLDCCRLCAWMQCFACKCSSGRSCCYCLSIPACLLFLKPCFLLDCRACCTLSCLGISCISRRVLQTYSMMQTESLLLKTHMLLSCRLMHMPLAVLCPLHLNFWLTLFLMSMSTPLQQGSSGACCILIQLADPLCSRHLMTTFCSLEWSVCLLLLLVF